MLKEEIAMQINILGYGLMGKQIAALLYLGGFNVNIWNHKSIDEKHVLRQVKMLKRSIDEVGGGTFSFYSDLQSLPDAVTIESVTENIDIKKTLFKHFEASNNLYFTNSSSFSPSEINENVNGLHFFNPVNLKLIEVFFSKKSIPEKFNPVLVFLEKSGFDVVKVNDNRGYIGNYILFNEISSALKLVEKFGYQASQLESVYNKLYDGRSLFSIIDLIGIDVVNQILVNLKEEDESIYLPVCLSEALSKNILGKKNRTSIKDVLV